MDLLIYLAVVAVLGLVYLIRRHRREGRRPSLGDAAAYEGNLIIPPAGKPYRAHTGHKWHGGGHSAHDAGHITHGGGHAGHDGVSGGHHH